MKVRAILASALLAFAATAIAASPAASGIRIEHPWIRWLPAHLPMAGYAKLVNGSDATVRLTGATSPDYRDVTLMQSRLAQGDDTMTPISHLDVPAHGSTAIEPGGYHIMLMHATHPIKPGDKVPITLHFAGGATLQLDFPVLPANSTGPSG